MELKFTTCSALSVMFFSSPGSKDRSNASRSPPVLAAYLQGGSLSSPLPHHLRSWLVIRHGGACSKRSLGEVSNVTASEVVPLMHMPLTPIELDKAVVSRKRSQRGLPPQPANLPHVASILLAAGASCASWSSFSPRLPLTRVFD